MSSNLRFPKVFVYNPANTALAVGTTVNPIDLTLGQVGFFNPATQKGWGATNTITPTAVPKLQIHQNIGDASFGTTRTKEIFATKVRKWYATKASVPTVQISYIGYDEASSTANLKVKKGDALSIIVNVYDKILTRWYGQGPYTKRFDFDLSFCKSCTSDCEYLDPLDVATEIARLINAPLPAGQFYSEGSELPKYMTASVVQTGTGDTLQAGVKLLGIAPSIQLLNSCDPKQFQDSNFVTFEVGIDNHCVGVPITKAQIATPGGGYPIHVAMDEMESQGYDRVRDQFDYAQWMKLHQFIINAQNGVKYDQYIVDFEDTHKTTGTDSSSHSGDYSAVIYVPTGSGVALEAALNAWLTPLGFAAVNISSGTATGTVTEIVNA